MTLETATPTFQVGIPTLNSWTLSVHHPIKTSLQLKGGGGLARASLLGQAADCDRDMGSNPSSRRESLSFRGATITSKGNLSATFTVPGTITIPSDDDAHNVTITQLKLNAAMSWIAVPKIDARVRLSVR